MVRIPLRALAAAIFALMILAFQAERPSLAAQPVQTGDGISTVRLVRIEGGISPAQADLLRSALGAAKAAGDGMLIVELDTPGGSGEAMRDMVKDILAAPMPVAVWVGPSGARAASAGVFLVAASNLAAMSPQSTIGAASPVNMDGSDINGTMQAKVKNDIMSFVRGVAESRGRNTEWYEKAVDKAASITAAEAVLLKVVDMVAVNVDDLLAQAGKKGVPFQGRTIFFDPAAVILVEHDPGFRHRVLSWLIDPQIAYFLLLGGMAGLFFELTTPGAILPGVLGGLCLLLGLYAMSVLPTCSWSSSAWCCFFWRCTSPASACSPWPESSPCSWARPSSTEPGRASPAWTP